MGAKLERLADLMEGYRDDVARYDIIAGPVPRPAPEATLNELAYQVQERFREAMRFRERSTANRHTLILVVTVDEG